MATLVLDKRTGTYKARVKTAQGTTTTLSTKATTKPEAKRILKQSRLAEIEEAAKAGSLTAAGLTAILAGKQITFEEAITQYADYQKHAGKSPKWIHESSYVLRSFGEDLMSKPINAVTEKKVYDFINAKDERNANWRRGQRGALNKFFEFCTARGWMLCNPARLVHVSMDNLTHKQKETKQRNPFTDGELNKLVKHLWRNLEETIKEREKLEPDQHRSAARLQARCDDLLFWYCAVTLGRHTGLRLGDIAQLEWDTLKKGRITVWTDKRDRRVDLALHPDAADAFGMVAPVDKQFIFPAQARLAQDVSRRANLSTQFGRLCDRVEIFGKTFHDIRSTYICECDKKGIPIEHIARSVGHVHVVTTRGYMPKKRD